MRRLVVDFFADDDTRAMAKACVRLDGGVACGFQIDALLAACERLAEEAQIAGSSTAPGSRIAPPFLTRLHGGGGCSATAPASFRVSRTRWRSRRFAAIARSRIRELGSIGRSTRWLARAPARRPGGGHIRAADAEPAADAQTYFQRRVAGRPVSALVLANGVRGSVLGFSEQWASPTRVGPSAMEAAARPPLSRRR